MKIIQMVVMQLFRLDIVEIALLSTFWWLFIF